MTSKIRAALAILLSAGTLVVLPAALGNGRHSPRPWGRYWRQLEAAPRSV